LFTAQQAALVGVAAVVCFVLTFASGVERGKGLITTAPAPAVITKTVVPRQVRRVKQAVPTIPHVVSPAPTPSTAAVPSHPYTIQLATYTNLEAADRELERLRLKGHSVFLVEGRNRVALCVGKYSTHHAAKQQLTGFRQDYHDCFIRRR
jgi:cell division septation protein DedD